MYLYGLAVQPNSEICIVASSFLQAKVIFYAVMGMLEPVGEQDKSRWRIQDSGNRAQVQDRQTGASDRCLGSDPRRLHGQQPSLVIADELAQWEPSKIDRCLAALETSLG